MQAKGLLGEGKRDRSEWRNGVCKEVGRLLRDRRAGESQGSELRIEAAD